ncbi:MAG TPA: DUF2007 domain-containing protein [Byssovorax sp.]|jgi:hypothetical protein
MAYRDKENPRTGRSVEAGNYLDLVAAELAKNMLETEGIQGRVIEATSFNPLLVGAAGGHRVMVDEADVERATGILRRAALPMEVADDEPDGTTRCPRCEHAYVRRRFVATGMRTRFSCDRCDHVWDDAKAGPRQLTAMDPDDPRPVFLLFKGHGGTGFFLGLFAGAFVSLVMPHGGYLVPIVAIVGWYVGRTFGHFVCSDPSCRAGLAKDSEWCPKCDGKVAGTIERVAEHYARAADIRREIAKAREQKALRVAAKKKKRDPGASPA